MSLTQDFSQGGQPPSQYITVRFTKPADQDRVYKFYQENRHKHVDARLPEVWNERTLNGRVILIEDNEDNIGFVSVAYDFLHEGRVTWMEFGSTINQQDPTKKPYDLIKGITLYPSIIAAQTIQEFLTRTPDDKFVACIFDDNIPVLNLLTQRVGWKTFEPDEKILAATKATKDGTNAHEDEAGDVWLHATTDTIPHQARLVLDFIDKGTVTGLFNKKSGQHVKLDASQLSLANEFRAAVEALAYGPLADQLENSPHMTMRTARELLETHMKQRLQSPKP